MQAPLWLVLDPASNVGRLLNALKIHRLPAFVLFIIVLVLAKPSLLIKRRLVFSTLFSHAVILVASICSQDF